MPDWSLAVAYWLHMLATIAWLGGLAALAMFVIPAARKSLHGDAYADFLSRIQLNLQRIGWLSLAVLTGTGMFQMSEHPAYEGFLAINNAWAVAIFAKHAVIGLMVASSIYITWGLTPRLRRLALMRAAGKNIDPDQQSALQRKETLALQVNLGLSVIILLLTALARVS